MNKILISLTNWVGGPTLITSFLKTVFLFKIW